MHKKYPGRTSDCFSWQKEMSEFTGGISDSVFHEAKPGNKYLQLLDPDRGHQTAGNQQIILEACNVLSQPSVVTQDHRIQG